jgi:hydrogenase/urease accessory protein HupE
MPRRMSKLLPLLIVMATLLIASLASAHPLAPALLSLEESESGEVAVRWKISRLRPTGTDVRPNLPAHCSPLSAPVTVVGEGDVTEEWRIDCGARGLVGSELSVGGLDRSRTDALILIQLSDGRSVRGLVNDSDPTYIVPEQESALEVARGYFGMGVEHLLSGLDHVLFVVGLVLLVVGWRSLLWTITAFTVGHSVTLSLATLGLVSVPTLIFELAIAFSILILGAELARGQVEGEAPSALRRRPWAMAFGFGLLHGLGFAGALSEIGLPAGDIPLALFTFNVGVEAGQLMIVLPVAVAGALLGDRLRSLPALVKKVPAYGIGSLAAFWCFERMTLFL